MCTKASRGTLVLFQDIPAKQRCQVKCCADEADVAYLTCVAANLECRLQTLLFLRAAIMTSLVLQPSQLLCTYI
jgi:hypothetical protein